MSSSSLVAAPAGTTSIAEQLAAAAGRWTLRLRHRGRRTGTPYQVTIWFLVDGETMYLVTANVRRQWVRNVTVNPDVVLEVGGRTLTGRVTPVRDRVELAHVVRLLTAKYWFVAPLVWLDRWRGGRGMGPRAGAFRVTLGA